MIYKTFYGHHIDLSKLIDISPAYFNNLMGSGGYFVGFKMQFQLMDKPIIYEREFSYDEQLHKERRTFVLSTDGEYCSDDVDWSVIQAVKTLQDQVDEIINAWKEYKEQSCG